MEPGRTYNCTVGLQIDSLIQNLNIVVKLERNVNDVSSRERRKFVLFHC